MKKYGIYVFSGTGNTRMCAELLRTELSALGAETSLCDIGDCEPADEEDLVICYPVHGFNAPSNVIGFCRRLPGGRGDVFFLKTSGEPLGLNDCSSDELTRILRGKGYRVRGEFHYIMPYNMVFRHSDAMAAKMWNTARERIPSAARAMIEDRAELPSPSFAARLMSGLCRVEHIFYPLNGRLFRVDGTRCIKCMQCVKNCPMGNISFEDGRFRFAGKCVSCTRCSFSCPADAIHIGLLDIMRVNGRYDFDCDPGGAVIGKYCKKAYERYFDEDKALSESCAVPE